MLCHKYARNDTKRSFLKIQNNPDYFQIPTSGGRGGGCHMWTAQVYPAVIKGLFSREVKMMLHGTIRNDDF